MANNQMDNSRSGNRQPSLREQANARMRAASGRPETPTSGKQTTRTAVPKQRSEQSASKPVNRERTQTVRTADSVSRPRTRSTQDTNNSAERQRTRSVQETNSNRTTNTARTSAPKQSQRTSSERRPQERPVQKQRPASREVIQSERSRVASRNTANSKKQKGIPKFPIFLGLYTLLLLVLAGMFLMYTDKSLKKFEKSQSEYYMSEYISTFEENAKNGTFSSSDFTFDALDLTFVDSDDLMNDYLDSLKNISSFTYEKDPNSYNTEAPIYNIYGDGNAIAQVTLEAVSQTKLLAILTVMDWGVEKMAPICSIDVTSYTFLVPSNYTPVINGTPVALSYQTGDTYDIEDFKNITEYVSVPKLVEYKVDNVLEDSTVSVLNETGEQVPFTTDGNKISAKYAVANATLSEERMNMSLQMVQTYEDFNTDDLSGATHGLATAQSLFIKDSYYWNFCKEWATGVDITFTSAHRFDDPKYSNVVVDEYMEYSDNCYSVHIAFTKNMVFTRRDGKFTNEFDSTVYFVKYDDTDDDVVNPQWYIADIIATTK